MSFKDDLRKKLSDEMFEQVTDALGDDFNYDVVPRSRLNKVIGQRDKLKALIEGKSSGTQTEEGSTQTHPEDSFEMPGAQGKEKTPTVEELRQQYETEKNNEITALKVRYAGLDALRDANVVDAELAYTLLDQGKMQLGEDGKLTGIEEQITALKESKPFLFTQAKGGRDRTPGGTGKNGVSEQFETVKSKEDFLKLSTTDQIKFKEAHPEVFKSYLNQ